MLFPFPKIHLGKKQKKSKRNQEKTTHLHPYIPKTNKHGGEKELLAPLSV